MREILKDKEAFAAGTIAAGEILDAIAADQRKKQWWEVEWWSESGYWVWTSKNQLLADAQYVATAMSRNGYRTRIRSVVAVETRSTVVEMADGSPIDEAQVGDGRAARPQAR